MSATRPAAPATSDAATGAWAASESDAGSPAVRVVGTQLSDPGPEHARKPLVVLGPSLGTSASALWSACAAHLADRFHLVAWDLPGHGADAAPDGRPFDMTGLAAGVLALADRVQAERGDAGRPFAFAGDSAGGAVGLQLLLDAPERVRAAVILCSSAAFAAVPGYRERAATVRASGTSAVVELSARRWFPDGFLDQEPARSSALLRALQEVDDESYARVCEALAGFDVRDRLGEIVAPVLAVAGSDDVATPPEHLEEIATGVQRGRLVVLDGVGHLAPAEQPAVVASLLADHLDGSASLPTRIRQAQSPRTPEEGDSADPADPVYARGMAVRREVLGDAHVDRATAAATSLTRDFQDLITRYAWGSIWTRPGLDRRSRSMITITALVARGHHEELAMHVRAARRNGLTVEEIGEVILQSAIYCGVPDANTAFRVAQAALDEPGEPSTEGEPT